MHPLHRYYQILEVAPNASLEEIHESYKDLVTVWHPDRFLHHPRLYHKAQEKIKQVNLAYEELRLRWAPVVASGDQTSCTWQKSRTSESKVAAAGVSSSSTVSQSIPQDYHRALDEYIRHHSRDLQNWLD